MNSRQTYRILPLLATLWGSVLMSSCDRADLPPYQGRPDRVTKPLCQGMRLGEIVTRSGDTSSAVPTTTVIGFFMKDPGTGAAAYSNIKGTYNSTTGQWAPATDPIWVDNRTTSLAVYAPYNSGSDYNAARLPLATALRQTDDSNDLLATRFSATNQRIVDGISLTLSHVYTRLVFTFVKIPGYTNALTINKCEFSGADIISAGSYDLFADTYSAGSGEPKKVTAAVDLTVPAIATPTPKTAQADLLVIPFHEAFTADALLEIHTTDGKHMKVIIPKTTFTAARPFAAGKQYNFTVKLSPSEAEIGNVTVNPWEDDATGEKTGEVQFD